MMPLHKIDDLNCENKLQARWILDEAYNFYKDSKLCDVILIVEERQIRAHKCILASSSPYFGSMFSTGMKEADQKEITIHHMDYKAFEAVIRYFYSSTITLTVDNIMGIAIVVDFLGVTGLQFWCIEFMKRCINVDNCVAVYNLSTKLFGYRDVAWDAAKEACTNVDKLVVMEDFVDMPLHMLHDVLATKSCRRRDEKLLLNAICEWVFHNVDQRGESLTGLLEKLDVVKIDLIEAEQSLCKLTNLKKEVSQWLEQARQKQSGFNTKASCQKGAAP